MVIYNGDCSWAPRRWNEMVDAMRGILAKNPTATNDGIWNEIVVDKPVFLQDCCRA